MIKCNEHLTLDEYLKFLKINNVSPSTYRAHKRLHKIILDTWKTPSDWINSDKKEIRLYDIFTSNRYWVAWSILKKQKLPFRFVKEMKLSSSRNILKVYLADFGELEETLKSLQKSYCKYLLKSSYSYFLKICILNGFNSIKDIKTENLSEACDVELVSKKWSAHVAFFLHEIMYSMGYTDTPPFRGEYVKDRHKRGRQLSTVWDNEMLSLINRFFNDITASSDSIRHAKKKLSFIRKFGEWYCNYKKINKISNLRKLSREDWLSYVKFVIKIENRTDKTKDFMLYSLLQFFDWLKVYENNYISENFVATHTDLNKLKPDLNRKNLAFEKREYGEKILNYLINDFELEGKRSYQETLNKFFREAIIIAANSGMRKSEISLIEFGSVYYSEDEQCYKLIIPYPDKLGQVNRPVYLTKDGYDAVLRAETLRRETAPLKPRLEKRVGKSYVHTFEFKSRNILAVDKTINDFLTEVKNKLGLVDENERVVKGGIHAFRHMFAMTVFRLSNYNLGVVRYLLGHRSYKMSEKYLVEENKLLFSKLREQMDDQQLKIAGNGLATLIESIIDGVDNTFRVSRFLDQNDYLFDIIDKGKIAKVPLGYCLDPCQNANKCFKCNKFLATENEKKEIYSYAQDLLGILSFKVKTANTSLEKALAIPSICKDFTDLLILIQELKDLGGSNSEIAELCKGNLEMQDA